jgi:hypothetical protein
MDMDGCNYRTPEWAIDAAAQLVQIAGLLKQNKIVIEYFMYKE